MMFLPLGIMAQSSMTDDQVFKYVIKEHQNGTSQSQIVTQLMQRGVDITQIRRVRKKFERMSKDQALGVLSNDTEREQTDSRQRTNNGEARIGDQRYDNFRDDSKRGDDRSTYRVREGVPSTRTYDEDDDEWMEFRDELDDFLPADTATMYLNLLAKMEKDKKKVFGRDIFNKRNLSFEPSMSIATPANYRLGPGDAVFIDIYGASQLTINETISPDGYVTVEGYGPILLSGLTVEQAQRQLRSQLGTQYQSSQLRLSVGQTKTVTVNVMGEVTAPGTYTVSAFATVFNALYMAGGITDIGTLRNIKVYRNNREISSVDAYEYIVSGQAKGNIRLSDNDVIIVGPYDCLVDLTGRVKRPMFYEMKSDESLASLIQYGGGFAGDAFKKSVRVMRKSGSQYSVHTVGEFDMAAFHMADGDSVWVDSVIARYANMVELKGAVFRPGMYELGTGITTVKQLVESADGLTEEAFARHAVMHRMRPNRTLEVLSVDLEGIFEGRVADVELHNEDVLFVPSHNEYQEERTLTIHGEVQFPGVYQYAYNETLEDFVLQAGGLNNSASMVKVDVARRIINPHATESQDTIAYTYSFALKDGFVIDGEQGFVLEPYDEVYVRKSPAYTTQQNVMVEGEVLFEGTYTLSRKNERLSEIIQKAGGLTKTAYAKGARLVRKRTLEEQLREEDLQKMALRQNAASKDSINMKTLEINSTYTVGISLEDAMNHPGGDADIVLREGDRIIVPEFSSTVKINGDVMYPNTVSFVPGKSVDYYINQAGGYGSTAKKSRTYIIYMNGTVAKPDRKHKPMPGCEIVVPSKSRANRMTTTEMLAIGTSTASIATMIATMVNLFK